MHISAVGTSTNLADEGLFVGAKFAGDFVNVVIYLRRPRMDGREKERLKDRMIDLVLQQDNIL